MAMLVKKLNSRSLFYPPQQLPGVPQEPGDPQQPPVGIPLN
jgi:hypothetical protein